MAGLTWFELDVDYHEGPKVKELVSRLRNPLADAYPSRLYAYCYKHVTDRFPAESASDTIEDIVKWKGRRGGLFDALFACRFLERDGGKIVVHGVRERLGPHVAAKLAAAERQRRHRAKVAAKYGSHGEEGRDEDRDVTRDITRDVTGDVTGTSRPYTDRDKTGTETETNSVDPASQINGTDPGWLSGLCGELATRVGRSKPLGVGKDPPRVIASFQRWIDAVGIDETVDECARLAAEKHVTPSNLSWWPGWLDTVTDAQLRRGA